MRKHYIFLDLGFYEDCNLKCKYCRNNIIINRSNISFQHLKNEINQFKKQFNAGVVKLSGYGEITLWTHFYEALEYIAKEFSSVQVITNGTFSDKIAAALCEYDNVNINFTIDGNTPYMNSYRTDSNEIHKKILDNLDKMRSRRRKVEVNSVLHDRNLDTYGSFLSYLMQYAGDRDFMVFPFPVKTFERTPGEGLKLRGNLEEFGYRIDELWQQYSTILPPKAYGDDLKEFTKQGRQKLCFVNWANMGSGGKDERLVCPNYGESLTYGDFIKSFYRVKECAEEETKYLYRQVGPDCHLCFNHYHIINLFLTNRITLQELSRVPSLCNPATLEIVANVKREFEALMKRKDAVV